MPLPTGILPPSLGDDTTSLVVRGQLQEMVPTSDVTFSQQQIIDLMNQELISYIVPLVQEARQEYFIVTRDYVLPPVTSVQNVINWIELPDEATGLGLRDVYVTDNLGNFSNIPRLQPEQIAALNPGIWWGTANTNMTGLSGFYLQGNRLYIYPYSIANNRPIRLTFQRRPARMVATEQCAQIVSIVGDTITVGPTIGAWAANTYVGFVRNQLPHDWVTNQAATQSLYSSPVPLDAVPVGSASGSTYTFATGITSSLSVGDWMCSYATAPFAQLIPLEASNLLVQATAARLLEALGDREGQASAEQRQAAMARDMMKLIQRRVIGKTQKVSIPSNLSVATNISWRSI